MFKSFILSYTLKRNILTYLSLFLKKTKCRAYDEQIEVIFKNENDIRKYKPDIFVMCEDATRKGESFTSAPKIVFEILSKSTAKIDKGRKYSTYEKFGVLEYNLVEQTGYIVSLLYNLYQHYIKKAPYKHKNLKRQVAYVTCLSLFN